MIEFHNSGNVFEDVKIKPKLIVQNPLIIGRLHTKKCKDYLLLESNDFVLAATEKVIISPNQVGFIDARSRYKRLGLLIGAGFIAPGFEGSVTLELYNLGKHPIKIELSEPIAHYVLFTLAGEYQYEGRYGNKSGPSL